MATLKILVQLATFFLVVFPGANLKYGGRGSFLFYGQWCGQWPLSTFFA